MFAFQKTFRLSMMAAIFAAVFLTGCFQESPLAPEPEVGGRVDGDEVTLRMNMKVGGVNAIKKGSLIKLSKMIVVLTSNGSPADTVRDTITPGEQNFVTTSTSPQNIDSNYVLKALRTWKIKVTVIDSQGFVTHVDSATTPNLSVGSTAVVNLGLTSRYTMYEAKFLSLPATISSTSGGQSQALTINRLVLRVDGLAVRDSSSTFAAGGNHSLPYDYVTVGSHTIQMEAYGPMNGWNPSQPLFTGSRVINVAAGADSTLSITLNWVGPTTGAGAITATLTKVGKVTIVSPLPGTSYP